MNKVSLNISISGLLVLSSPANSSSYQVEKNDVLSVIIHSHLPGPVWGKEGSLQKILKLNPQVKNPDLIYAGDTLRLSEPVESVETVEVAEVKKPEARLKAPASIKPFSLKAYHSFTSFNLKDESTGATSVLASKFHLGLEGRYSQQWTPTFKTFLGLHLGWISFEPPASNDKSLTENEKFLPGLGIGMSYEVNADMNLTLAAHYQSEIFLRAKSTSELTLDAVPVPSLGGKLDYRLLTKDPFILGVSGNYAIKLPTKTSSYTVHRGQSYGAGLFLEQTIKDMKSFRTELDFNTRSQDTSTLSLEEKRIVLGIAWEIE